MKIKKEKVKKIKGYYWIGFLMFLWQEAENMDSLFCYSCEMKTLDWASHKYSFYHVKNEKKVILTIILTYSVPLYKHCAPSWKTPLLLKIKIWVLFLCHTPGWACTPSSPPPSYAPAPVQVLYTYIYIFYIYFVLILCSGKMFVLSATCLVSSAKKSY